MNIQIMFLQAKRREQRRPTTASPYDLSAISRSIVPTKNPPSPYDLSDIRRLRQLGER